MSGAADRGTIDTAVVSIVEISATLGREGRETLAPGIVADLVRIHGAALSDGQRLLVVAEDVGRHNAVDKVKGEALLRGIPTEDRILLSTGRVSSEMLLKAARMGVPLVASRTSPTEMAVALAEQLNITVCGYVRPDSLNLYAGEALLLGRTALAPHA